MVVNAYSDKLGVNGCPFNYREKMRVIIVSVLFGLTAQLVMKENVIFQKIKEVTTVRARWMVAFVEDLLPFERFLNKTQNTTVIALRAVLKFQAILAHYNPEKKLDINGNRFKHRG